MGGEITGRVAIKSAALMSVLSVKVMNHRVNRMMDFCQICGATLEMVEDLKMPCPGRRLNQVDWDAWKRLHCPHDSHVVRYLEYDEWHERPVKEDDDGVG